MSPTNPPPPPRYSSTVETAPADGDERQRHAAQVPVLQDQTHDQARDSCRDSFPAVLHVGDEDLLERHGLDGLDADAGRFVGARQPRS